MSKRTVASSGTSVTVEQKGTFDDDAFFKDSLASWDQAMQDVVKRWDSASKASKCSTETRRTYRDIRSSNLTTEDSQAVSINEEDDGFRIVIDVKDFKPEEISVKVVDEQIVVEGKIERKDGKSSSSQQFIRKFMLPPNAQFSKVSSALSRDGVLKVNCPKHTTGRGGKRGSISCSSSNGKEPSPERRISCEEAPFKDQQRRGTLTTHVEDSAFDNLVDASQQQMDKMKKRSTMKATVMAAPVIMFGGPPPKGCITTKDTVRRGDTTTEREEGRWEDAPAPGVTRQGHVLNEKSTVKGHDGATVGSQESRKEESESSGGHEEILPDGTKRKVFTQNYETRQVFSSSGTHSKAL